MTPSQRTGPIICLDSGLVAVPFEIAGVLVGSRWYGTPIRSANRCLVSCQDNPQSDQPICGLEKHLVDQLGVGNVSVGGEVCLDCSPGVATRHHGLLNACTGIHRVGPTELDAVSSP
jgi:hypothetical protein